MTSQASSHQPLLHRLTMARLEPGTKGSPKMAAPVTREGAPAGSQAVAAGAAATAELRAAILAPPQPCTNGPRGPKKAPLQPARRWQPLTKFTQARQTHMSSATAPARANEQTTHRHGPEEAVPTSAFHDCATAQLLKCSSAFDQGATKSTNTLQ